MSGEGATPGGASPGPRACTLDQRALDHARRLAADWRATGLRVVLVERVAAGGGREGYELVAEGATAVLTCACRCWRREGGLSGPAAWTVAVSARRPASDPDEAARELGVAAGASPEAAWGRVLAWMDGGPPLHADLGEALATTASPDGGRANRRDAAAAPRRVLVAAGAALLVAAGLWAGRHLLGGSERGGPAWPEAGLAAAAGGVARPVLHDAGGPTSHEPAATARPAPATDAVPPERAEAPEAGVAGGPRAVAEATLRAALERSERDLGPEDPGTASALDDLASLYLAQGRYGEAEPLLRRAVAIDEEAFGPDDPDVALGLTNIAGLYGLQGRHAEAEPLYRRALAIDEAALGPDDPDVAAVLQGLGNLYRAQGRDAEAGPVLRRALAIRERTLGPEDPDTAATREALAALRPGQDAASPADAGDGAPPRPEASQPVRTAQAAGSGAGTDPRAGGDAAAAPSPGGAVLPATPAEGSVTVTASAAGPAGEATEPRVQPRGSPGAGGADAPGRAEGGGGEPEMAGASSAPPTALERGGGPPPPSGSMPRAGRWAVQVASVRDRAEAPGAWRRLAARHPALAGLEPRVQRAVPVPGKGTFYRVMGGSFATEAEARAVCDRLRADGEGCLVAPF